MKYSVLLLLCAVALVNADKRNGCPHDWSVERLIPHKDCDKFYQCWNGERILRTCPSKPQLYFNPKISRCDWPEVVDCSNRDKPGHHDSNEVGVDSPGNGDPSQAGAICAAEGSDGILVAHEECNKFYKCFEGKPVALSCPGGLLYAPKLEQCDWPENVKCGDRVIPGENDNGNGNENGGQQEGGNSDPGQAGAICAAEGSDGVLVAHEECNKFYKCFEGKPVALSCPGGLLYAPKLEQCDWPENVKCGDRVIPGENDSGNGNENGGQQEGGNSDPGQAGAICAAEGSDGVLVAHEECNKFYKCLEGKPVALSCPGGLLYAPKLEQCDWPENVNCADRVISGENDNGNGNENGGQQGGGNSDPGQAGAICAAEGSDGVLVAHEECNKFYKCLEGKPVALSCPGGLLYAPKLEQCDWPENVNCADRVISGENDNGNGNENGGQQGGGNSDPGQAGAICAAEGSDGVLVAHEECNKFYKCLEGKPVALSCPGGLLYAPKLEQCDWPENVDCADRVISGENDNGNGNENGGQQGGGNSDPGQAGAICAAEGSDGILVAHEECNKFYKCLEGKPVALSCPGGLLYAPKLEQCDWPENVKCGDRVILDENDNGNGNENENENENENGGQQGGGNSDPSQAGAICAAERSDGILVAHEKCNKFYKCLDGEPVALSCPGGLLYAPEKEQCDWPENVDCKDRW